jgi:hypothetical protein
MAFSEHHDSLGNIWENGLAEKTRASDFVAHVTPAG